MKTFASTLCMFTWWNKIAEVASQLPLEAPPRGRWVLRFALAVALGLLLAKPSHAAEYGRSVIVGATLTMAGVRPAYPLNKNLMLVYVNASAWGSSTCRQDAVVIQKTDTHLLAQLLIAMQAGDPIAFYVDDTLRPLSDNLCQVALIQVGALPSS